LTFTADIVWPNNYLPSDGTITTTSFIAWDSGLAIATTVIIVIVVALNLLTLVFIWKFIDTPVVRFASPYFLATIIIGLANFWVSLFGWFGKPTKARCNVRIWFGFIGFAIAYSSLTAKTGRLWYLFRTQKNLKRVNPITNAQLALYVTIMTTVPIIILIFWTAFDPLRPSKERTNSFFSFHCSSSSVGWVFTEFVYCGLLTVAGIIFSFKTRKLPSGFRETHWINLISYDVFFCSSLALALGITLYSSVYAAFIVIFIGFFFGAGGYWMLLFGPKMYIAWVTPEKNTTQKGQAQTTSTKE